MFPYVQFESVLEQMKEKPSNIGLVNNEMSTLSVNLDILKKVWSYVHIHTDII